MPTTDIVIVEDEGLFALDLQMSLERLGYRVVGIADVASDAVSLVRQHRPALVLMDIRIRGEVDGVDAAREIYLRFETPVIFVTGNADDLTLNRATASEPFGYIMKPVDQRELKAVIETALHRHGAERRLRCLERWLTTTLDSISDAVVVVDRNGFVAYLNRSAEALTGWQAGEALGRAQLEVLRRVDLPEAAQSALMHQVVEQSRVIVLEPGAALRRRDGVAALVQGTISPIVDEGEITGAVVVLRSGERPQGPPS